MSGIFSCMNTAKGESKNAAIVIDASPSTFCLPLFVLLLKITILEFLRLACMYNLKVGLQDLDNQ